MSMSTSKPSNTSYGSSFKKSDKSRLLVPGLMYKKPDTFPSYAKISGTFDERGCFQPAHSRNKGGTLGSGFYCGKSRPSYPNDPLTTV